MKTYSLILLGTLLFSCASKNVKKETKQGLILYNQGTQELRDKEYTIALKRLQQANKMIPNDTNILNNLGMAYYFKGSSERARLYIKKAIKVNPKNTSAMMNLATVELKERNFENAEKLYKKILKDLTYLAQFKTYYNLGVLNLERNNKSEAIKYFKKSLKENPNYCPSHQQLGQYYFKQRKYKTALKKFKDASFGICYNSPLPHYYQAKTLVELGELPKAEKTLNLIMEKHSGTKYFNLAKNQMRKINSLRSKNNRLYDTDDVITPNRKILTPDF